MSGVKHEGDQGTTAYLGNGRLSKSDLRFEALGALDEIQAILGVARASLKDQTIKNLLYQVQKTIPLAMAEVASDPINAKHIKVIQPEDVTWLDDEIVKVQNAGAQPKGFLISGETVPGAFLDLARTITRRAERQIVRFVESEGVKNPSLLAFFNRLSLLLFYLEALQDERK